MSQDTANPNAMPPTLYIVATPIGTLADLSPRAREVLASVAFVACEDTRHSGRLLMHFGIHVSLQSLHEHNEAQRCEALVQRLCESTPPSAAVITDAGTPCVSDPGSLFVACARKHGVRIMSVPGPSSLTSALAACGFLQPRTLFSAFLPRKTEDQNDEFVRWRKVAPCIAVFFESPLRVKSTLTHLKDHFGGSVEICLSREISKFHEEHVAGAIDTVLLQLDDRGANLQGECVVCVNLDGSLMDQLAAHGSQDDPFTRLSLEAAAQQLIDILATKSAGESMGPKGLKDLAKKLADANRLSAKELYNRVLELQK